jgi:hypothetical protein
MFVFFFFYLVFLTFSFHYIKHLAMFLRFIVLIALICYSGVSCYCIYNESDDATFGVRQLVENTSASIFTRFKRELLGKGQSGCCPYTEKDCVFNRKKDTVVFLNVSHQERKKGYGES